MNFENFESKGFYERKNDVFYIYIKKDKSIVICYYYNYENRLSINMEIKKSVASGIYWSSFKKTENKSKLIIGIFTSKKYLD